MNWTLALPEIVLACVGMATLIFGVLKIVIVSSSSISRPL